MAGWPDQPEFEQWLSGQPVSLTSIADRLPFAFDAALEVTQDDVCVELFPGYDAEVSTTAYDEDDNPTGYHVPGRVRLAVFILAHRLVVRADSPTGVIGFQEFAVRVGNDDPDYARLIRRYYVPGIA